MAITDVIQKVFASTFLNHVSSATPFVSMAQDRSADVLNSGSGLVVPVSSGLVTVADYPAIGTDITYSALSPEKVEFDLDKKKYIAFQFEETDAAQVGADVWSQAIGESASEFAKQLATDFRSLFSAASVPAAQTETVILAGAALTTTERQNLVMSFYDVISKLRNLGHETRPTVFVPTAIHRELTVFFSMDKPQAVPSFTAAAFADAKLSAVFGCDIVPDWGDTTALPASSGATNPTAYAVIPRRTIGYAQQLSRVEQLISEGRFARLWRSLKTYGMGVQEASSLHKIEIDKT